MKAASNKIQEMRVGKKSAVQVQEAARPVVFHEWLVAKVGKHFAVTKRRTQKLRERFGHLMLPREYDALRREFATTYPQEAKRLWVRLP